MLEDLPPRQILAIYNANSPKPVAKFENQAKALRRTLALIDSLGLTPQAAAAKAGIAIAAPPAPPAPEPVAAPAAAAPEVEAGKQAKPTRVKSDRVVEDADGFYAIVDGKAYGTWTTRGAAEAGMAVEQRRAMRRGRRAADGQMGTKSMRREQTPTQAALIRLCTRQEGATAKELMTGLGWPSIAARTTCQNVATRFGYALSETPKTKERSITFRLTPIANAD